MEHNYKQDARQNSNSELMITDFGSRAISNQNFSKVVALPKTALDNCGNPTHLNVSLIQENGEKFLKLSPSRGKRK